MRIVEILVGANALFGILTYLGIKASIRRAKQRAVDLMLNEGKPDLTEFQER